MNNFRWRFCSITAIFVTVTLTFGCAGLSQQYKATTEGMTINYTVNKEQFFVPKENIFIISNDERVDKEVIGEGAKPTVGRRFMGYLAFGVFYAAIPDQPSFREQEDPIGIFKSAMTERLSKNGVDVTNNKENDSIIIELFIRRFKLDFNFGKWLGEVEYIAKAKRNEESICESNVYEKSNTFNLYGYGSGEKAINEAFNKAINKLDINNCFSKLKK